MRIQDKYEAAFCQDIGGRKEQQDRVAVLWHDEACLIVLADGLGGHDHGAFAAQTVVDVADEVFNADPRAAAANCSTRSLLRRISGLALACGASWI